MTPERRSRITLPQAAALAFAAAGGVCALVVPAHRAPVASVAPPYGHPILPWFEFAFSNVRLAESAAWFLVLGGVLGLAQPRRWLLNSAAAMLSPALLHGVNVVGDWVVDPTSHNLIPFEYLLLLSFAAPAPFGAFLGSLLRGPDEDPAAPQTSGAESRSTGTRSRASPPSASPDAPPRADDGVEGARR